MNELIWFLVYWVFFLTLGLVNVYYEIKRTTKIIIDAEEDLRRYYSHYDTRKA